MQNNLAGTSVKAVCVDVDIDHGKDRMMKDEKRIHSIKLDGHMSVRLSFCLKSFMFQ